MRLRAFAALAATAAALISTGIAKTYPTCDGPGGRAVNCYVHVARPVPPPAPTEATSPWKRPPWRGLGIHVAWGFETGQFTPQQLADRLESSGFDWACLEGSPEHNEPYMAAFRDALHGEPRPLRFCIWERADRQKNYPESYVDHAARMIDTYHPDFYGADAEAFPLEDSSFPSALAERFPNLPRIWIVAGLPDAGLVEPWVKSGWDVMAEDYAANIGQPVNPGITCPVDHDAYWRGILRNAVPAPKGWGSVWCQHGSGPHTWPIVEVHAEGNASLAETLPAVAAWGRNFSIWDAEQMTDQDWATAASLSRQP